MVGDPPDSLLICNESMGKPIAGNKPQFQEIPLLVSIQLGEQKRRYVAHFVSKLTDADGEQAETQHWLDTSLACEYISSEDHGRLFLKCKEIGRMLGKMMQEPEKWCARFGDN